MNTFHLLVFGSISPLVIILKLEITIDVILSNRTLLFVQTKSYI